jgi:hypothetical protein
LSIKSLRVLMELLVASWDVRWLGVNLTCVMWLRYAPAHAELNWCKGFQMNWPSLNLLEKEKW